MSVPRLRLVFAGTPDFAVPGLCACVAADADLVAVYTQPDRPAGRGRRLAPSPVKQAALEAGIPVEQHRHARARRGQRQPHDIARAGAESLVDHARRLRSGLDEIGERPRSREQRGRGLIVVDVVLRKAVQILAAGAAENERVALFRVGRQQRADDARSGPRNMLEFGLRGFRKIGIVKLVRGDEHEPVDATDDEGRPRAHDDRHAIDERAHLQQRDDAEIEPQRFLAALVDDERQQRTQDEVDAEQHHDELIGAGRVRVRRGIPDAEDQQRRARRDARADGQVDSGSFPA